jgi:hypothetical protein
MKLLFTWITLTLLTFSVQAAQLPRFGEVSQLEGDVKLYRQLRSTAIDLSQDVFHRDRVRTGDKSTLGIDVYDGTKVVVSPLTRMTLTRADVGEQKQINLQLLSGTIRCKVTPLDRGEVFVVRTPVATAGVRGTDFITSYSREKGLTLTVLEGEVEIISLKEIQGEVRKQSMKINEQIRLNDNFEFLDRKTLSPADRQKAESSLPIRSSGGERKQDEDANTRDDADSENAASRSGGKVKVRRLKDTIKSVTVESKQNLFRDTINQAQRESEQAELQLQFNLVNP